MMDKTTVLRTTVHSFGSTSRRSPDTEHRAPAEFGDRSLTSGPECRVPQSGAMPTPVLCRWKCRTPAEPKSSVVLPRMHATPWPWIQSACSAGMPGRPAGGY